MWHLSWRIPLGQICSLESGIVFYAGDRDDILDQLQDLIFMMDIEPKYTLATNINEN